MTLPTPTNIIGSEKDYSIQYRSLHLLLFLGIILSFLAAIINIFLEPNMLSVLLPAIAFLFCVTLYMYARRGNYPYIAKVLFILFVDFIYFPLAWVSTAGSLSSMPFYAILFLIVTFLLIEYPYEYLFPFLFMMFTTFLMYAELRWPELIGQYETTQARSLSLGVHYIIVAIFIGVIIHTLLSKYMDISRYDSRKYTRDELTGLYSRNYALKTLKKSFEIHQLEEVDMTLIYFKLHNLKAFNEAYGTLKCDQAIKSFAHILTINSRASDVCCRYSGDTFWVLLDHTDDYKKDIYLDRIMDSFNNYMSSFDQVSIKLLVGTASFDYNSITEVIKQAELSLQNNTEDLLGGQND